MHTAMMVQIRPIAITLALMLWLGPAPLRAAAGQLESALSRDLSKCIRAPVDVYSTDHFRILHTRDADWAPEVGAWLEHLLGRFEEVSERGGFRTAMPAAPLTWICFSDAAAYETYNAEFEDGCPHDRKSYYSSLSDRVVLLHRENPAEPVVPAADGSVRTGIRESARIAHEAAHQLSYSTGIQTRGVMYPLWVSEGLATFYEGALLAGDASGDENPGRRDRLVSAYRSDRLVPLEKLVTAIQSPGEADVRDDFYAACWGLMSFLVAEQGPELRRYLGLLSALHAGPRPSAALSREFARAFGDPAILETRWRAYVESLADETKKAGNDSASPALTMCRP
jgi:hypothetical protein